MSRGGYSVYPGRRKNIISYLYIPFLVVILLSGIFSLVWLRSSVISLEYRLGDIEGRIIDASRERKTFEAELASVASIEYLGGKGFAFPTDRKKVFYVKRGGGEAPYSAAYRPN